MHTISRVTTSTKHMFGHGRGMFLAVSAGFRKWVSLQMIGERGIEGLDSNAALVAAFSCESYRKYKVGQLYDHCLLYLHRLTNQRACGQSGLVRRRFLHR